MFVLAKTNKNKACKPDFNVERRCSKKAVTNLTKAEDRIYGTLPLLPCVTLKLFYKFLFYRFYQRC